MDTNVVILIGRMTKDIETRTIGEHIAGNFTLAVNGYKKDEVSFIDCKCWNSTTNLLSKFTSKGSKISVIGSLKQETWEKEGNKHSRIVLNVKEIQFLDPKKEETPEKKVEKSFDGKQQTFENNPFSDDEIPF
jgi:single-strand DNA-binding protein